MPPDLEKFRSLAENVFAFRETLSPESDRGCALMAGAFLDDRLKLLIQGSLIEERKLAKQFLAFNGPAGTFSSRIDYAYLTALIPKSVHADLHLIRDIRNKFGHRIDPIDFTTPEIRKRCEEFQNTNVPPDARPRLKFTNACFGVLRSIDTAIICQVPRRAKEERLMSKEEKEASHKSFVSKFDAALAELSEEEISADPAGAKKRLFAKIIGEEFREPNGHDKTDPG